LEYASSAAGAVLEPRYDDSPTRSRRSGGGSPPNKRGNGKSGGKGKGPRRRDPLWARLLVIFGALLMLGSGTTIFGYKLVLAEATKSINQQNLLGSAGQDRAHVSINGTKNILLVGVDSRPDQNPTDLVRSDSIMILHIPADHNEGYLVSIPRDTYVQIPAYNNGKQKYAGGHEKINAAFAFGGQGLTGNDARKHGIELLGETLKNLYGVSFAAAAIIDFNGFQEVVKALGGVDMTVDEKTTSIHIGFTKSGKEAAPYHINSDGTPGARIPGVTPQIYNVGYQHLAAWQALDYVRQRDLLAKGDADYGRQRHQQQFIKAVFKEIASKGVLTNPGKLSAVLDTVGKAMTLDDGGISIGDWVYAMRGISTNNLITIKTNGGQFASTTIPGIGSVETLNPTSLQLLQSVRDDNIGAFVALHPDWVSQS
jgi:LCP family protein required for cell wall assembly